jgi:hypothetical protein
MVVLDITQKQKRALLELIWLTSMEYAIPLQHSGITGFLHSSVVRELLGVVEEIQSVLRMDYTFDVVLKTRLYDFLVVTKSFEK